MVTGADLKSRLFTYDEAMRSPPGEPLSLLTQWMTEYPMNAHPELGRTGAVCPFVKKASKFDTLRVAISEAGPGDEEAVFAEIRSSFADLMKRASFSKEDRRLMQDWLDAGRRWRRR